MKEVALGEITTLHYGKALAGYQNNSPADSPFRVFGTNGPIGWTAKPLFKGPSIIVGRKGAYRETHWAAEDSWVIDTAYYLSLNAEEDIDLRWLFYKLKTIDLNRLDSGAAIPSTKREDFYAVKIKHPKLIQQKQIASVLNNYDDLIENNRRRIQLLEESARLLYQEWFVHLRFPSHEQIRITNGVPDGWTKEPLEHLLTLQRGFDLPVSKRLGGPVPIYASTGVNGFHNTPKVKGPGVVTGRSGTLGRVMFIAQDFWPLNTTLWVKEFKKVSPIFATYLLRAMKLEGYNGGAAVPTLNRNDVHKVDVLCPDQKLMSEFENQTSVVFQQIDKLKEYNQKLAQARDLLLPKLMSGELTV